MTSGPYPHGTSGSDSTGLLIIRAWTEDDGSLRARIVSTTDVTQSVQIVRSADSAEEVQDMVREWLTDLVRAAPGPVRP